MGWRGVTLQTGFAPPVLAGAIAVGLLVAGCGSDRTTQTNPSSSELAAGVSVSTSMPADASVSRGQGESLDPLSDCLASNGVAAADPARSEPAPQYPPEVAIEAWGACRDGYLQSRQLPPQGDPLAFADCMATFGWIVAQSGFYGLVEDPDQYRLANDTCRTPVDGESSDASYCRLLNSIFDVAMHDTSMSVTGVPNAANDEDRLEAAIALYDQALQVAPEALVEDLQTMRDAFRLSLEWLRGNGPSIDFPDDAGERVFDHNISVCGAPVYLGSLD